MASRSLLDLTPAVRSAALRMQELAAQRGVQVLIYCTLRSMTEQAELYAYGRTRQGRIVTMARPGESLHNPGPDGLARAFDAVPMVAGYPEWSNAELLTIMGEAGEAAGLEWGGRWRFRDSYHFQERMKA